MLLCGIDLGTSSIKVSIVNSSNQKLIHSVSYPEKENEIISPEIGWAEQDPNHWFFCVKQAILKANSSGKYNPLDISSIGISYQMHGLVVMDSSGESIRNSIIWCDSRATNYGNKMMHELGEEFCLSHLLNSPGNFTAAKLAWVKENQPAIYEKIDKVCLPGDFISYKLTQQLTTSSSSLSEGIFWDFQNDTISSDILKVSGFSSSLFPVIQPVFSNHGKITPLIAKELGLSLNCIVGYKAGDQPNNALSLGVLSPGEIATTAGTSGVVYGVADELKYDDKHRVNSFAHVNHSKDQTRIGVLMCINGTGIMNRWVRDTFFSDKSYPELNDLAGNSPIGAKNILAYPFGNGAERIFLNKTIGAHFLNLDLNRHQSSDIVRATQEGIAFSLVYGMELMGNAGIKPKEMRAGLANMYLSPVFTQTIVNASGIPVKLMNADGSFGAALGAGVGSGIFINPEEAMSNLEINQIVEPNHDSLKTKEIYKTWKENLSKII